jgi:hypothetical protein
MSPSVRRQLRKKDSGAGHPPLAPGRAVGEVFRLAARVSVLRDGELIASGLPTASLDAAQLGQLLTGRRGDDQTAPTAGAPAAGAAGGRDRPPGDRRDAAAGEHVAP